MNSTGDKSALPYHKAQKKSGSHGAVTIEYALVFPLVIFCVMLLIYLGLVYYQQALLQSIVTQNTQNWAYLWGYDLEKVHSTEGVVTREAYQSEELYWQVFSGANRKKRHDP